MPIDFFTLLALIAGSVATLVGGLSLLTLAVSVRARRRDRKRREARRTVRGELFEQRRHDDPDWEAWIGELSPRERTELATIIEQYLRTVSGHERRFYLGIARVLQMGEQANAALAGKDTVARWRAIARLTVIDYPVPKRRVLQTSVGDQRSREASARLLAERHDEYRQPETLGVGLLIWHGDRPMTAWGLDTLYEHTDGNPTELLVQANRTAKTWDDTLLSQACIVLESSQITADASQFEWLFPLFDHENPRVRAATIRAFRQVGWQPALRERIPFRQLLADEPMVRRATYRVLAHWADRKAQELLEWAVIDEENQRAQLLAVRALASIETDINPNETYPAWPSASWDWVRAEIAVDEQRRLPTRTGVVTP